MDILAARESAVLISHASLLRHHHATTRISRLDLARLIVIAVASPLSPRSTPLLSHPYAFMHPHLHVSTCAVMHFACK